MVRLGFEERFLQASGSLLRGGGDDEIVGAVVVLNDVTRLKRLEAVRSDFVANVSHELKTPVTSIKGFAETLLDGAMADEPRRAASCTIIAGQADRLTPSSRTCWRSLAWRAGRARRRPGGRPTCATCSRWPWTCAS